MYITKTDAISVVTQVQYQRLNKLKKLDQDERKFILEAIKIAESDTLLSGLTAIHEDLSKISKSVGAGEEKKSDAQFESLKGRVQAKMLRKDSPYVRSYFFIRFFKFLANLFLGRVSSEVLIKAIKITQEPGRIGKYEQVQNF